MQFIPSDSTTPVANVQTPPDGTFRVELAPGRYDIRATNLDEAPLPSAEPLTVDVTAGQFTQIIIQFDSGVR